MLYIIHLAYPPIKVTPYSDSQGSGCGSAKRFWSKRLLGILQREESFTLSVQQPMACGPSRQLW